MSTAHNTGPVELPTYPDIKRDWGEDPARFLTISDTDLAVVRIRGINELGLINAWRAVERRENGGRYTIERALDAREAELRGGGSE